MTNKSLNALSDIRNYSFYIEDYVIGLKDYLTRVDEIPGKDNISETILAMESLNRILRNQAEELAGEV